MMKHLFTRLAALLMVLLLLPLSGLAAEKLSPIEQLGAQLIEAQAAFTQASEALTQADKAVADLEKKYNKNPNNSKIQDQLIDAMIGQEAAVEAFAEVPGQSFLP